MSVNRIDSVDCAKLSEKVSALDIGIFSINTVDRCFHSNFNNFHKKLLIDNNNNNNVHLSCVHQRPERSHDTY